jgi:predicted DNA-binding protein
MKRTNLHLPEQMLERLKRLSASLDMPISQIIRDAVDKELSRLEATVQSQERQHQAAAIIDKALALADALKRGDVSKEEVIRLSKELASMRKPDA